jgi:alkanesulfonate monooxygenase SsuD/methylene tetrahydromethanopterin reductase-like flavin-dependent oxidoreductase (luciferase family)
MTTVGAVFLPQNPPERLRAVAEAADEAGLDELWLWEDCFWESGVAAASAALAWTRRVRVGVGLLPVPLRNVALAAMEMATMHRLFPDRAVIAVGHGVQSWMGQVGARVESPVTLLREHLEALHALLRGENVTMAGRYVRLDGVRLVWPPVTTPPVLVGTTGPRSIRLSGSAADGTLLTASTTAEGVRAARALVDEGRASTGRTDPHPITVYLHATTGPAARERLAAEFARQGYDAGLDVGVAGSAEEVAAGVLRYAAAGADTVVLQPTEDEPDPADFVRFAAGEVAPLVREA